MRVRNVLAIAVVLLAPAGGAFFVATRPPARINVLVPDGAPEFSLMDFSTPFALDPPPAGWFHRKFWTRAPMRMVFVEKDGVKALRMETNASASMLFRFVDVPLTDYPILKWRWFVEKPVASPLDERTREGDDHPARFFLALRARGGEERRFEIIWGNRLHRGDVKYIGAFPHWVADGGDENLGRWRDEKADLAAIAKQFWPGDDFDRVTDVALFCDTDETKTSSVAYVADVQVAKR